MFHPTPSTYQQGAKTLPGECYTSAAVFAREREAIFGQLWHCTGRTSRLAAPGDYFLCDVAGESLIVVRGQDHVLRAFFNVCRHRGTRLCQADGGSVGETIQCPYHAWTYATDGRLVGAPHMQAVEGFDKADYPLHEAAIAESNGFVFVSVARDPQPFADWFRPMLDRLDRFGLAALEVRHRVRYEVEANWKLVFQNYSECLHCPVIHPELASLIPYQSSANDLVEGPFLGGYMDIDRLYESVTMTGRACGAPVSPELPEEDRRRAYYYSVMPNLLLSIHPDYVNYYVVTPLAPDRTVVESEWLFVDAARQVPAFDPAGAVTFWDVVNRQDWRIIERSQLGITSSRYTPGPYSPRESIPAAWDRCYLRFLNCDL
jgi:Rieske 2Fe-2S family protein